MLLQPRRNLVFLWVESGNGRLGAHVLVGRTCIARSVSAARLSSEPWPYLCTLEFSPNEEKHWRYG